MLDIVLPDGTGQGDVASRLLQNNFDVGCLRPFFGEDGRCYITVNENGKKKTKLTNNATTLRKDEWKVLDATVIRTAQAQMRLFADIRSRGLVYNIPNGMGKTVFEYEKISDISPATTSMDGLRESDSDRPHFDLGGLPLPIIHKDFQFSARQIAVSRNGSTPLDTTSAELATRKVVEEVEKYTVGTNTFNYAGYNVYGYTNFPQRLTQSITAPSSSNHATTISEVLSMKKKSVDNNYFGPWVLYFSPAWDLYLDEDYSTAYPGVTLRSRLMAIDDITSVRTSYFLTGNTVLMVQMTSDVVRAVIGMDVVTLQWESQGGMAMNFKVMCIQVPQLRADFNNQTGIIHGS